MPLKRKYLETNVEQLRGFLEELNTMNNWINSLNLDLLRQNSIQSLSKLISPVSHRSIDSPLTQSPDTEPVSHDLHSPNAVYSTNNNLVDSNVSLTKITI